MSYINRNQRAQCHAIIHSFSASTGAVGAGLAQLPCSDSLLITPLQVAMAMGLGRVFGLEMSESTATAAVATAAATALGRAISQFLVGWIPGIGNILNAATAASVTEGIGWLLAEEFAQRTHKHHNDKEVN